MAEIYVTFGSDPEHENEIRIHYRQIHNMTLCHNATTAIFRLIYKKCVCVCVCVFFHRYKEKQSDIKNIMYEVHY